MVREVVLAGEFRPYQSVDLHAKVAGYIRTITVDIGDRVKAGQLIATLEIPELEADIASASAERKRASAEMGRARAELDRARAQLGLVDVSYTRLVSVSKAEKGLIAQQELDEAAARKQAAEAQVSSARAALAVVEQQIESSKAGERRAQVMAGYSQIAAPFSGIITKRYADLGAMIQAGTASQTQAMPVVRLADISRLRMMLTVPESIVPKIHMGQAVKIRVGSLNRSIQGSIARISSNVEFQSRTMDVEVDVPNPSGQLVPGMYADVVLTISKSANALTIPVNAIANSGGNRYAMVVTPEGVLEERKLDTGMEDATRVEVLSGLGLSDMVVVGNRSLLRAGQKVNPKLAGAD